MSLIPLAMLAVGFAMASARNEGLAILGVVVIFSGVIAGALALSIAVFGVR